MSIIYVPFSFIMKICVMIAQNSYLFGLLFYALVFQVLLFPFAIKQQKSQVKMASVRPKEMAIRKKYAGRTDRVTQQRMQQEIQEMYQQEGYSPLSGCLPLLIQLPLIFILYAIVRAPIQYSSDFSTAASKAEVVKVVTELHGEYVDGTDSFASMLTQYTFDYTENLRAHLIPDAKGAKEVTEELNKKIAEFGSATEKKKDDKAVKYENGLVAYTIAKNGFGPNSELTAADILINYGESYVDDLIKQGILPETFDKTAFPLYYTQDGKICLYEDEIPSFSFLGINLLMTPSFSRLDTFNDWILLLIPILVFLTSFFSNKITRKFQPPQLGADGKPVGGGLFMTVGMPLLSAVFTLMFPAAIGAYWVWRTLLSMVQPPILNKMYPIPAVTQEAIAEEERKLKGKSNKKKKVITIEVDEDDDSYSDLEVKSSSVEGTRPKEDRAPGAAKKPRADLPYRKPTKIEMLSAEDDEPEQTDNSEEQN